MGVQPAVSTPSATTPSAPDLRENRDFMTLWGGQSVSVFGTQITQFALPWLVLDLSHAAFAVGALNAISFIPYLLFSLPAGLIADRWNRRTIMLVCDIGRAVVVGSVPVAYFLGHLTLVQLFVVGALGRLFTVFFDVGYMACLPNIVEKPQLTDANGKLELTRNIAEFSGQPIGGLLVTVLTAAGTMVFDAVSYVVSAISLFAIKRPFAAPAPRHEEGTFWHRITEGIRYVWRDPLIRALALAPMVGNLATSASFTVLVFRARDELHFTAVQTGIFVSCVAIGQAVAALLVGRVARRVPPGRLIFLAALLQPLFLLGLALTGNFFLMVAIQIVWGFAVTMLNVPMSSLRQTLIPDHILGRAISAIRLLVLAMYPIGALVGGALATISGARTTFAVAAAVLALAVGVIAISPIRTANPNHAT